MKPENSKYSPGKILIDSNAIRERVEAMAVEIAAAYKGRDVIIVALLRGSFVFLADLIRCLFECGLPVCVDFLSVSSYGAGVESSGRVNINHSGSMKLHGRNVILLDDILDTGLTISEVVRFVEKESPADLKICTLLDKPTRRKMPVKADFLGFTIDDKFVVGYGLDYNDDYRYLPYIAEASCL